ncbi:MAG: hypothetical protein GPJ54_11100 [Candidatus Heimdallarchaeota archaeon]|nr:hypothetical protein [Candidatus Heimdallarchaeota archaeon]
MKEYGVPQSIVGQNKPKFNIAISIWDNEEFLQTWLRSKDRERYLDHHLDFYGDIYYYKVLLNKKSELSDDESGLYGTISRYVIKAGTQEDYIRAYGEIIEHTNLKDFGAKQTLFLLSSTSETVFSRITIWESKEDLAKWRAAGTQIALMDKYLDHYLDTIEFDVLKVLFQEN